MGAVRLELRLASQSEWIKIFDPRDWTVFVQTEHDLAQGALLELDLDVDGWLVTLRGTVAGHRDDPAGVVVAIGGSEREKINYLNGYVRGGLLNLRDRRRLPVRLAVTYGAIEGPTATFTRDINELGAFLVTDRPLPEGSQLHMLVTVPGQPQPLSLVGKVSHTIEPNEGATPGMGVVFELDAAQREQLGEVMKQLEQLLRDGQLPPSAAE